MSDSIGTDMTIPIRAKRLIRCFLAGICLCFASGAGAKQCTLSFNATSNAQALPVTLVAYQHIQVGTVIQDCNNAHGYTLVVESGNCPFSPAGAKLMDNTSGELVHYSVGFYNNASGGGISIVSGLLTQTCAAQVARDEHAANGHLTSDVFLDFTGVAMLSVGTYSDTLSVTLNLK